MLILKRFCKFRSDKAIGRFLKLHVQKNAFKHSNYKRSKHKALVKPC